MAQKREKEETELKVPKSMPICSPPIPTSPSKLPGTEDQNISSARLPGSCSDPKSTDFVDLRTINSTKSYQIIDPVDLPESEGGANKLKRKWVSRCSGCKRKLGLMGFRCRCGEMFCSTHRYSDRHECSYDYKAVGREAIARENPVVRAAKIVKV